MVKINKKKHVTKDGKVKKNPKKYVKIDMVPLVATYESMDDLYAYFDRYSGNEKALIYLSYGLTINMLSYVIEHNYGVKIGKMPMVATYKSPQELEKYFERYSGSEKAIMYLGYGLTWNHVANHINKQKIPLKK